MHETRLFQLTMMISLASATSSFTVRPELQTQPGSVLEPEPKSPTDTCLCVVRCCKTTMRKRRAAPLPRSMPLVRRKRCCGCQDCGSL